MLGTLSACTTSRPYVTDLYKDWQDRAPASELVYEVFLFGDGGNATLDPLEPTLRAVLPVLVLKGREGEYSGGPLD